MHTSFVQSSATAIIKFVAENCVRGHADCHTFEDRATCDANSEKVSIIL